MSFSEFSRSYIFKNTSELLLPYIFCSLKPIKQVFRVNIFYILFRNVIALNIKIENDPEAVIERQPVN